MKVLVCGGRDFTNFKVVCEALDVFASDAELIIHGGARGADSLAQRWADAQGICCRVYYADWDKHGKSAGPIRNQLMLEMNPDKVIAFPGGRGTADMVKRAEKAGIKVIYIKESE